MRWRALYLHSPLGLAPIGTRGLRHRECPSQSPSYSLEAARPRGSASARGVNTAEANAEKAPAVRGRARAGGHAAPGVGGKETHTACATEAMDVTVEGFIFQCVRRVFIYFEGTEVQPLAGLTSVRQQGGLPGPPP